MELVSAVTTNARECVTRERERERASEVDVNEGCVTLIIAANSYVNLGQV